MKKRKLLFRADGNHTIGLGHIVRSLALVEMVNNFFECVFIIRTPSEEVSSLINKSCNSLISIPDFQTYKDEAIWISENIINSDTILILDGYNFNTEYQKTIKKTNCFLICIDDIHSFHFVSDIVINHVPGINKKQYSAERYTKFYLGEDYALLRKQFLNNRPNNKSLLNKNVLICFGGSDGNNITQKVLMAINNNENINQINIVIGSAYLFEEELKKWILENSHGKVNVFKNINADEMVNLMSNNFVAICPASSIAYEAIAMNLKLLVGLTAENQREFYDYLILKKINGIGSYLDSTVSQISEKTNIVISSSQKGINLIDGLQQKRYIEIFKNL